MKKSIIFIANNTSINLIHELQKTILQDDKLTAEDNFNGIELKLILSDAVSKSYIDELNNLLDKGDFYSSLLIPASSIESISYSLLRAMQDNKWRIIICDNIDLLLNDLTSNQESPRLELSERRIELIQKFRIDVDFYFTLPNASYDEDKAKVLFNYLVSNKIRSISFYHQQLISEVLSAPHNSDQQNTSIIFFNYFYKLWKEHKKLIFIDDIRRVHRNILNHFTSDLNEEPILFYLKNNKVLKYIEADIPTLDTASKEEALNKSKMLCKISCEYFSVCGGELYSNKYFFNKSISSSRNAYCESIRIPCIETLLEEIIVD